MDKLNSNKMIDELPLTTNDFSISLAELTRLTGHTELTEGEKLLWMHVGAKTSFNAERCCGLPSIEEITHLTPLLPQGINHAMQNLKQHGFLNIINKGELGIFYSLSLPSAI